MNEYYTSDEIIARHPTLKVLGWNSPRVGVFYRCLLVEGRYFGKHSRLIVRESSLLKLREFAYDILTIPDVEPRYLSYEEVMHAFPQAAHFGWSPTIIGILYHSGLLCGKSSSAEARNLVTWESARRLIEYTGQRFLNISKMPYR